MPAIAPAFAQGVSQQSQGLPAPQAGIYPASQQPGNFMASVLPNGMQGSPFLQQLLQEFQGIQQGLGAQQGNQNQQLSDLQAPQAQGQDQTGQMPQGGQQGQQQGGAAPSAMEAALATLGQLMQGGAGGTMGPVVQDPGQMQQSLTDRNTPENVYPNVGGGQNPLASTTPAYINSDVGTRNGSGPAYPVWLQQQVNRGGDQSTGITSGVSSY